MVRAERRLHEDEGARDWEPRDDDDDDVGDRDLPLDVRRPIAACVADEVFDGRPYPVARINSGLLDVFVQARLEASATVARGPLRRSRLPPRVVSFVTNGEHRAR
jgi:hypothetical protein